MTPRRLAAIDIGSNAIRFLAAECSNPDHARVLDQQRLPIRLGHDVFTTGRLSVASIAKAVDGLQDFARRMDKLAIQQYRAVATSAVRDSSNGLELVERARHQAGVGIETISGDEEARLVHLAVRNRIVLGEQSWLLADLGGGSLELSIIDAERIHRTESFEMGAVRMIEASGGRDAHPETLQNKLEAYGRVLDRSAILGSPVAGLIATGGNIEALARLADPRARETDVAELSRRDLRETTGRLMVLSYDQRVREYGLRADRADVIVPAAMLYERIAEIAKANTLLVPYVGVKDGVLLDLWKRTS